ncbi:hypothetical protein PIB30_081318 [Stylosanthes scabra]|uniref:Uncharacterized protein n=1 Tax=Stylosanthes scabra TaxID=79078 RepID=A0ABU6YSG1_9FABA|nr:hypothetical protein [Stylosanthes scabra]
MAHLFQLFHCVSSPSTSHLISGVILSISPFCDELATTQDEKVADGGLKEGVGIYGDGTVVGDSDKGGQTARFSKG